MSARQKQEVFKDFLTNKNYQIPQKLTSKWQIYRNRYTLGIAMGSLLWSFNVDLLLTLCLSIAFLIVSEIMFRIHFLPKCKQVEVTTKHKQETPPQFKIILTLVWGVTAVLFYLLYRDTTVSSLSRSMFLISSVLASVVSVTQAFQLLINRK